MRRLALLLLVPLALAGPARAAAPDPIAFFTGRSEGHGVLKKMLSARRPVIVRSVGRVDRDGWLVLSQHIVGDGDKPRDRVWKMREVGDRIEGSLTDAIGPVTGEVSGNRLHVAFAAKSGLAVEQWITFAPDGRSAQNHLTIKKFGITVATLDETIRKLK